MIEVYSVDQVLEKTLTAKKDLPVYNGYPPGIVKRIGTVKAGNPAGIVFSYIAADPTKGRDQLWWMFYPASSAGSYYYMPHDADAFDLDALRQQGVISVEEQQQQEQDKNKEWYEKVLDKVLPVVVTIGLGAAVIKGLLSRKS